MKFLSAEKLGALYAISSGLCYGLLGYFGVSLMHAGLSVFNMLFWRFAISTLFVLILLIPNYKKFKGQGKESLKVFFYGMVFYSGSGVVYFIASKYIGTGLSMVIFFVYPAIVILFNFLLYKTRISKIYYFACVTIMIGMILLVDIHAVKLDVLGILLGIISAVFYASYIVASKKVTISPMLSTLMVSAGCTATCFIISLLDSSFYIPTGFKNWFDILGISLLCTAIPILLLLQGLKYISSEKAAMLSVFEPVFVAMLGVILLDEKVTTMQIIGTIIMLSGALMALLQDKNSK